MGHIFHGRNTSTLYLQALDSLVRFGEKASPRGKTTSELRPVIFEYHDPTDRVTMLKGRLINPFFQLAEALWIVSGRSDVAWLAFYNSNMANFSDNGVHFNAPYGERLRSWGKNDASEFSFSPIDQLHDVYRKLQDDPDTRQAVASIADPRFDNYKYTNVQKGKDIACNLNIKFKIRNGKLDINVDNRSNDLHWGTFGANLCQFATIQEVVAKWLGIGVGTYYQCTDSLHIYLDDYGHKVTQEVLQHYPQPMLTWVENHDFFYNTEPRMALNYTGFTRMLDNYWRVIDPYLHAATMYTKISHIRNILGEIDQVQDDYWRMTFRAMVAFNAHKAGSVEGVVESLAYMPDCKWKVSCLRFLSKKYSYNDTFRKLYSSYPQVTQDYIERKGE